MIEESKIVIVNIETTKNDPLLNETPFRILQDSLSYAKKYEQTSKKQFQYLEEKIPQVNNELKLNYETSNNDLKINYETGKPFPKPEAVLTNQFENIRLQSLNDPSTYQPSPHRLQ